MLWYGILVIALCVYDNSGDGGETGEDQEVVHQNKQPCLRACRIATAANMNKMLSAQR